MTEKVEISTSAFVARQLTENQDDMVDAEEEISFEDLTITINYSGYDILEEEKENITKKQQRLGKNQKKKYIEGEYC